MTETQVLELANRNMNERELKKRGELMKRKPYLATKMANIAAIEEQGGVSPIIRLEKSYLCNFQCTHCSAEYYMDRHLIKTIQTKDERPKIDYDDIRKLSKEADELGLARFVITGGEPLVMNDFDEVVAAIDPEKHYIISDSNGWFLDEERAKHIKSIGVEKIQMSLDSFIEADHDKFRNKPGSYKRVFRAVDACLNAGLNLILSTVLVKGRARTPEFREMCKFATDRGIGLYVSYAKPTGSCTDHPEFVIEKEDADIVRELEKEYNVFTHMTPSYGSYKGCITVKGIITVSSIGEVMPCPYIDMSLGNVKHTPLKEILSRGMKNPWLGPYRPDCLIGEDPVFIKKHTEVTAKYTHLPVPYGEGFSDHDSVVEDSKTYKIEPSKSNHTIPIQPMEEIHNRVSNSGEYFNPDGRCIPLKVSSPVNIQTRGYFKFIQPELNYKQIYSRIHDHLGPANTITLETFTNRAASIINKLEQDRNTSNIIQGVAVPFFIPKTVYADIGETLETKFLPALDSAYKEKFPAYTFMNHCKKTMKGLFSPVSGTRHDRLLALLEQGDVVGYFFPCLSEYSIPAAREMIRQLPETFLLAGGFDTCATLIGSPDLMFNKDSYPPLLWLAALEGEKPEAGYHFETYGYNLTFNRKIHKGSAAEYWNCGLVVLG